MTSFSIVYPSLKAFKANEPNHDSSGPKNAQRVKEGRALITTALKTIKAKADKRHHITISGDDDAIGVTVQLVDEAKPLPGDPGYKA
jgi:hypothetical protein